MCPPVTMRSRYAYRARTGEWFLVFYEPPYRLDGRGYPGKGRRFLRPFVSPGEFAKRVREGQP